MAPTAPPPSRWPSFPATAPAAPTPPRCPPHASRANHRGRRRHRRPPRPPLRYCTPAEPACCAVSAPRPLIPRMHLHLHPHPLSLRPPSRCFIHSSEGFQGCLSRHSDSAWIADWLNHAVFALPLLASLPCTSSACRAPRLAMSPIEFAHSVLPTNHMPIAPSPLNIAHSFHHSTAATAHHQVGTFCNQPSDALLCRDPVQGLHCAARVWPHVNESPFSSFFDCVSAQPSADLIQQKV